MTLRNQNSNITISSLSLKITNLARTNAIFILAHRINIKSHSWASKNWKEYINHWAHNHVESIEFHR